MQLRHSNSAEETLRIGEEIGKQIEPPRVIMLYGELGSGKTVLTCGLARGLAVADPSDKFEVHPSRWSTSTPPVRDAFTTLISSDSKASGTCARWSEDADRRRPEAGDCRD